MTLRFIIGFWRGVTPPLALALWWRLITSTRTGVALLMLFSLLEMTFMVPFWWSARWDRGR